MLKRNRILRLAAFTGAILLSISLSYAKKPSTLATNTIVSIERQEGAEVTRIRINCEHPPTFTSFKLQDPVRIFVDVANGNIDNVRSTLVVQNGVVDRVGTLRFQRNGEPIGRVIIGLNQAAVYDVRRDGRSIEILIDATHRTTVNPDGAVQTKKKELEGLQEAIDAETEKIESLQTQRQKLEDERARLKKETQQYEDRFESLSELENHYRDLEGRLAKAKNALEATKGRHGALEDAITRLKRVELDRKQLQGELENARKSQKTAGKTLSMLTDALSDAQEDLNRKEKAISTIQKETDRLNQENRALTGRIHKAEQRAGLMATQLSSARTVHDNRLKVIQDDVRRLQGDVVKAEQKIQEQKKAGKHRAKETRTLKRLKAELRRQLKEERAAQNAREEGLKTHVERLHEARAQLHTALAEQKEKQKSMRAVYQVRVERLEERIKSLQSLRAKEGEAARARAILMAKTKLTDELERLSKRTQAESKVLKSLTKKRVDFEKELGAAKKALQTQNRSVRAIQATTVIAQSNLQTTQKRLAWTQKKYDTLVEKRAHLRHEVNTLEQRAEKLRVQRETKLANMAQLKKENSRLTTRVASLEGNLNQLQSKLASAREKHHLKVAKLSAERTILQTRIRSFEKRNTSKAKKQVKALRKLKSERAKLQKKLDRAQTQQRKKITKIESERNKLRGEVRRLQAKLPSDDAKIARLRSLLVDVQQQAETSREQLERRAKRQVASHQVRIRQLENELKSRDKKSKTARLRKELSSERRALKRSRRQAKKLASEYKTAQIATKRAKKEFAQLEKKVTELKSQLVKTNMRHDRALSSIQAERNEALKNAEEAIVMANARQREADRLRTEADTLRSQLKAKGQSGDKKLAKKFHVAQKAAETARAEAVAANQVGHTHQQRAAQLKAELGKLKSKLDQKSAQITALRTSLHQVQKNQKKPGRIKDIRFEQTNQGPRIIIQADRALSYQMNESTQRMDLTLTDVVIPGHLERVLDTRAFNGPIVEVATYRDAKVPTTVHVEITRNNGAQGGIIRSGERLVWAFRDPSAMLAKTDKQEDVRWSAHGVAAASYGGAPTNNPAGVGSKSSSVGGALGGIGLPPGGNKARKGVPGSAGYQYVDPYLGRRRKKRKYSGRKVNLTIKDADILHVLTFLAKEGKINIITSQTVQGSVSFHFENVHWLLALEMVLKSKGLDYVEEDGVYRIAQAEEIQKEYERELEKRKKLNEFKQLVVKLIPLNYASANAMSKRVKEILSSKGTVGVDSRTNTLVVKDVEEHVVAAEDLVMRLDTQTPQVLIEARIVEASDNFSRELGIQWGGGYTMAPMYGNETGLMFPGSVGISGGADDPNSPLTGLMAGDQPNFAVNMPAAAGLGSGGALALSLASINGAGTLNLRLSAAEEEGSVKIISSPRVATMDNQEAVIEQGVSIPISVVSANGVSTQFFQADLRLNVTPHVTPDGNISMKLQITKNEPDFGTRGSDGNPTIQRKEARTQLLVKDGETAVIGGIFTRNTAMSRKSVPFFGDLPLLGWLFRSNSKVDKRSELLIFVTPRIVNREASKPKTEP